MNINEFNKLVEVTASISSNMNSTMSRATCLPTTPDS